MELSEGLRTRHSVRAFLDRPVEAETLRRIIGAACRAPSAGNMQPWELYAVRGQTMERLRSVVRATFENGGSTPPSPGLASPTLAGPALARPTLARPTLARPTLARPAPEVYSERRRGLYREADPYLQRAGRSGEFIPEGSYRFFGAPAAVLVYVHEDLLPLRLVCCGAFMTQLTLAAHAEGLGTCAIGFVRTADRQMREVLSVPEEFSFVVALAVGYPDPQSPVNEFRSSRVPVDEVCRFFD